MCVGGVWKYTAGSQENAAVVLTTISNCQERDSDWEGAAPYVAGPAFGNSAACSSTEAELVGAS